MRVEGITSDQPKGASRAQADNRRLDDCYETKDLADAILEVH